MTGKAKISILKLIRFRKGYRVGFREPEQIIDHFTFLRAILSVAYMIGDNVLINRIGECATSSLFPAVPCIEGSVKLLIPFPPLPMIGKETKKISWITLKAAVRLLKHLCLCLKHGGTPVAYLKVSDTGKILVIECYYSKESVYPCEFYVRGSVACDKDEGDKFIEDITSVFFSIEEVHSRIDRVTNAADLYRVTGYGHRYYLWLAISCPDDLVPHVETALNILSRIGVGSCRSRGWGQFEILDVERDLNICKEDYEALSNYCGRVSNTLNILLGALRLGPWIDQQYSFVKFRVISGISGSPIATYKLPVLIVADSGSIVYIRDAEKYNAILKVKTNIPDFEPVMIFNPLSIRLSQGG